jgi:serine phosphatase RsbU (regulator of sigma subunit)
LCLLFSNQVFAQNQNLDSLEQVASKLPDDTTKVKLLTEIAWKHRNRRTQKSIELNEQANILCAKLGNKTLLPKIINQHAVFLELIGKYPESLNYAFQVVKMASIQHNNRELAYAYNNISNVNYRLGDYTHTLEYAEKAIKIFTISKDSSGIAYATLRYAESLMMQKKYTQAHEYAEKGLEIRIKIADIMGINVAYLILGKIAMGQKKYKEALIYLEKAKQICIDKNNEKGLLGCLNVMVKVYLLQNNLEFAKKYALQTLELTKKTATKVHLKDTYENLAEVYYAENNYVKALEYQNLFTSYKKEVYNDEKAVLISSLTYQYQNEEEIAKLEFLKTQADKNRIVAQAIFTILALFIILLGFILRSNYRQRKSNSALRKQQKELNEKSEMVANLITETDLKNEHIIASIQYAKRIQTAVLVSKENMIKFFPQSFVLFKPKDIVSGDFYWAAEKEVYVDNQQIKTNTLIAVGDCTGHGVPGGFMSLIGCSLLDQIVHGKEIHQPDLILTELHNSLRILLRPEETDNNDGMDISICLFDNNDNKMLFASATQSLYYLQNNEILTIKGDKKMLGGILQEAILTFTLHTIDFKENMIVYLATDGYADQFGGDENKRFSTKSFRNLLEKISNKPMNEQVADLETTFENWLNVKYKQMDDITVVGVKF